METVVAWMALTQVSVALPLVLVAATTFVWFFRAWDRQHLTGVDTDNRIARVLADLTALNGEGKLMAVFRSGSLPSGPFVSRCCCGWLSMEQKERGGKVYTIFLLQSSSRKGETKEDGAEDAKKLLPVSFTGGNLFDLSWEQGEEMAPVAPLNEEQKRVTEDILDKERHSLSHGFPLGGVFHLRGGPGTGKTTLSKVVASRLLEMGQVKSVRWGYYDPTKPACTWGFMKTKLRPSAEHPVVLLVDEADKMMERCLQGEEERFYKYFEKDAFSKASLNGWLDAVMETPHVIVMMTMNQRLEETDMDPSVYRLGRRVATYDVVETVAEGVVRARFGLFNAIAVSQEMVIV